MEDDDDDLAFLDLQDESHINVLIHESENVVVEDDQETSVDEDEDTRKRGRKRRKKNVEEKEVDDEDPADHVDVKSLLKNRRRGAVYLMERERYDPPCYDHREQKYRTRVFKWRADHLHAWMRIREQSRLEWHVQTTQPECEVVNGNCMFCRNRCMYWHTGECTTKLGIPPGSREVDWGLRYAFEEFRKECSQMPDKTGINWYYFETSHQLKFSSVYWKPTFKVCTEIVQLLCRDDIVINHLNVRGATSRHLADFLLYALLFHVNHAAIKQLRILYRLHVVNGPRRPDPVLSRCVQVQRLRHLRDIRDSIRAMEQRVPLAMRILLHHIRYTQQ